MTKKLYRSEERGKSDLGWLQSRFSFSFADYYDPNKMGFGKLRVLNDDVIAPSKGFGTHPHRNMEIISIITSGALAHKDSMGTSGVIRPGEVQVISAGSGVMHSEYNHLQDDDTKLFQIWIETNKQNVTPRYDQKAFDIENNNQTLVVSGDQDNDALLIHQDAKIWLVKLDKNKEIEFKINPNKGLFIFVIEGEVESLEEILSKRDAMGVSELEKIIIKSNIDSYFMVIDVPIS
jgi:redox-sensitive bicupin YhaK (pirin superfamily)